VIDVGDNLRGIRERIAAAAARRGPGPDVTLIGVAKHQPVESVRAAIAAGLTDVGENYAQELRGKQEALTGCDVRWHFIGGLQSNKVKLVVGRALIHTVDRPSLISAIATRARGAGVVQAVLLEVNLGGEAQKAGAAPEDVPALLDAIAAEGGAVVCRGLMALPPQDTPDRTRTRFAALRGLMERQTPRPYCELRELSMGMSGDFEEAILEGATLVRVGTAIFGARAL
jgi:pyridoxal phosphate enzyme (YggS family)